MTHEDRAVVKTRKVRQGARGVRKVKTGCLTCKIRHKKCDEARPACSRCAHAGWKCEFVSAPMARSRQLRDAIPPIRSLRYPSARPLLDDERVHMEYFHVVCAREFSLYFELPIWENVILQGTLAEPALHHAALAIGTLSRIRYHPPIGEGSSATLFSIRHYGLALQALCSRLDESSQTLEIAIFCSVVFSLVEFLLGMDSQVEVHLQAGGTLLESLYIRHERAIPISSGISSNPLVERLPASYDLLATAIFQLTTQLHSFIALEVQAPQRQLR